MQHAKWFMSDTHACGRVRAIDPMKHMNRKHALWRCDCKTAVFDCDFERTNLFVFQCAHKPGLYSAMKEAQRRGIACVYDIDDNWFECPEMFSDISKTYRDADVRQVMKAFIENADLVTCSTRQLAVDLQKHAMPKETYVIHNSICGDSWEPAMRNRTDDELIIGWMASPSHIMDAPIIKEAMTAILQRHRNVRFVIVGSLKPEHVVGTEVLDRVEQYGWVAYQALPSLMANFDIGICPLGRSPWNDGKSEVKWVQYSALSVPSIVSPSPAFLPVVKDGIDAVVVKQDSPAEWYTALERLILDQNLRKGIGRNSRVRFLNDYDLRNTHVQWADAFGRAVQRRSL
jgi:glycosyltransferase involved in cell wall biosynthesis